MNYHVMPYKDEILYSQIARLFDHKLEYNVSQSLRKLFDNGCYKATLDLPNHLTSLFNNYYYQIENSVDSLINKYTIYPFYECFLRTEKRERILDYLRNGSGSLIHVIAGINSSNVKRNRYPRYCPQCIIEDREQFYESYWRRIHQVPGVLVCPLHNVFIREFKPSLSQLNHSMFIAAERLLSQSISIIKNRSNTLLMMSKIMNDALNQRLSFDINTIDYKKRILNSQYIKGCSINYVSLLDAIVKYYGMEALNIYFPGSRHPLQWVPSVIRRPTTYFDPIKHMLLFNFVSKLDYRPELFKSSEWDGPWKCVNAICKHFGKSHIKNADVFFDHKLKRTAALVKCECGLIYKISFILKNGVKTNSIVIKDYGELWRKQVLFMKSQGKSVLSIANLMCTSFGVVSRFLQSVKGNEIEAKDLKFQNELVKRREEWKRLIETFGESKIVQARKANNRLYKWLNYNDLTWLQITNKLYASKPNPLELKLNWDKIDDELISKIAEAFNTLKSKDFKGRITTSIISKLICKEKNYLKINLEKLPKTGALLDSIIESTETYQKRRLSASIFELKASDESLTLSKVIRYSGLKRVDDPKVLLYIEEQLNKNICA